MAALAEQMGCRREVVRLQRSSKSLGSWAVFDCGGSKSILKRASNLGGYSRAVGRGLLVGALLGVATHTVGCANMGFTEVWLRKGSDVCRCAENQKQQTELLPVQWLKPQDRGYP